MRGFSSSLLSDYGLALQATVFTLLLFCIPIALLGASMPFLNKKLFAFYDSSPKVAGLISSWSTLGGLLGIWLSSLWLIPVFGTRASLQGIGLLVAVVGATLLSKNRRIIMLAVLVSAAYIFFISSQGSSNTSVLYQKESKYNFIRVLQTNSGARYLTFMNPLGRSVYFQSVYAPEGLQTGMYYDSIAMLAEFAGSRVEEPRELHVLILGNAGGTIARQIKSQLGSGVIIDAVELDPEVTYAAEKYLGLDTSAIHVIHGDARQYLRNTSKTYDFIISDTYSNNLSLPWELVTAEFWKLVQGRLNNQGIVALNLNSQGKNHPLFQAVSNTVASVFSATAALPIENSLNYILVSSKTSLETEDLSGDWFNVEYSPEKIVLTDDRAAIELLSTQ